MTTVIGSPSRYIQGYGELRRLEQHTRKLGRHLFVLTAENLFELTETRISDSIAGTETTAVFEKFSGECSQKQIGLLLEQFRAAGCDLIVGVGGGKILDTAKAAAFFANVPAVLAPTAASTDAPCSSLSVLYTEDGVLDRYLSLSASPDMVVADTEIISAAPARLLAAGMGDALSTYFEARACKTSGADNCIGGKPTLAAMQIARLCYDTLLADGFKAMLAAERKACTRAVENIIEANIYLSGIGFESGGLAAAHAVHNGLTLLPETRGVLHGEKVAFGTLVQLVLENAPAEEIEEVVSFCTAVGLPTTLCELGLRQPAPDQLMAVANRACEESDTMGHMPFAVTPDNVYAAILGADAVGHYYQEDHCY